LPFLPLTVSQRRPRSVDNAAPTPCDRRRHVEPGPNAGGARLPRPINPSKVRWLSKNFGPLKLHFWALWDSTLAEAVRIVDYDD